MNNTIDTVSTTLRTSVNFAFPRPKTAGSLAWETMQRKLESAPFGLRVAIRRGMLELLTRKTEGEVTFHDVNLAIFASYRRNAGDLGEVLGEICGELFG